MGSNVSTLSAGGAPVSQAMRRRCSLVLALAAFITLSAGVPARANLIINTFYDTASINAGAQTLANVQQGFNYAAQQFQNAYANNITVNIVVKSNPGTAIFGSSNYSLNGTFTYDSIRTALINHATTAADAAAIASLPAIDPTGGANFSVNYALAKALGYRGANNVAIDGTFTFGDGYNYTFDPNNRGVPGKYDFIGVAEHEVSEILGRVQGLGADFGLGSSLVPFDLFRYTSLGSRSLNKTDTSAYFSIDGGGTNLKDFNPPTSGDLADWKATIPYTADAYNNGSASGVMNDITPVDATVLDVIGFTPAVPEPASLVTCALPLLGGLLLRRRNRILNSEI